GIFLIACFAGAGLKAFVNHQLRHELEAFDISERAKETAAFKMPELLPEVFSEKYHIKHEFWTRAELEIRINGGKPFVLRPGLNGHQVADWINPASSMRSTLAFKDDKWDGYM